MTFFPSRPALPGPERRTLLPEALAELIEHLRQPVLHRPHRLAHRLRHLLARRSLTPQFPHTPPLRRETCYCLLDALDRLAVRGRRPWIGQPRCRQTLHRVGQTTDDDRLPRRHHRQPLAER